MVPIILFTYKRLDTLRSTVEALKENRLSSESVLYIYSDGPKTKHDLQQVTLVRNYIATITGFKDVIIKSSDKNKGLASSIISGVTEVLNDYDSIIVLEDDLIVSSDFLDYMNTALAFYEDNRSIISISGFCPFLSNSKVDYEYDTFITPRHSSWGWATWKSRWKTINWDIKDCFDYLKKGDNLKRFKSLGANLHKMLKDQYKGNIDSWAIRFLFNQFQQDKFTVFPTRSKVTNIGFGNDATHTKGLVKQQDIFVKKSTLAEYRFWDKNYPDQSILASFMDYYSFKSHLFRKIKSFL